MPARIMEMGVGASTCASGSQVWNGGTGTLIANAMKKNTKIHVRNGQPKSMPPATRLWPVSWPVAMSWLSSGIEKGRDVMSRAERYSAMMPSSISTEPASVYRKNLMAAYSRRGPPQMPIRKYIGRSITSQKIKKRKKSRATKTPIMPASNNKKSAKYPLTPLSMPQEAKIQRKHNRAVSSTIEMLRPSTPTKY